MSTAEPGSVDESVARGVERTRARANAEPRVLRFRLDAPRPRIARRRGTSVLEPPVAPAVPNRRDAIFRRVLAAADVCAGAGGIAAVALAAGRALPPAALLSVPLIVLLAKTAGRYDHDDLVVRKSTLDEAPELMTLAAAYVLVCALVAMTVAPGLDVTGSAVLVLWGSTAALLVALRMAARGLVQRTAPPERLLIVGDSMARASLARCIASDPSAHVEVVGFLPLEDERRTLGDWGERSRRQRSLTFDDLASVVSEQCIDRVLLTARSADSEQLLEAVRRTVGVGVKVSLVPQLFEIVGSAVEFDSVGGVTVLGLRRPGLSRSSSAAKRAMDVAGACLGLIVLAPLGLAIALAIKLDSRGPVFFRQPRVGRDGRAFWMYKFRSMFDGAEAQRAALHALNETTGIFKLSADPRVTRVGRWLRRTSLDELPQLINVLRGEMSLVGPRPLVLDEDRLVEGPHRQRLQLAPGMTGPWQVLGPHRPALSEMVKIDYLYAANWSLWSDVKIVLRTFGHVLSRRGR